MQIQIGDRVQWGNGQIVYGERKAGKTEFAGRVVGVHNGEVLAVEDESWKTYRLQQDGVVVTAHASADAQG